LQIIRFFGPKCALHSLHGHNGLDAMTLADNGINDRLIKQHSLMIRRV